MIRMRDKHFDLPVFFGGPALILGCGFLDGAHVQSEGTMFNHCNIQGESTVDGIDMRRWVLGPALRLGEEFEVVT